MNTCRPNHCMARFAERAVAIAAFNSRVAAVEFLLGKGCAPDTIARILTQTRCGAEAAVELSSPTERVDSVHCVSVILVEKDQL